MPLEGFETGATQICQKVQSLVVAPAQSQRLRRRLLKGLRDQRVDQPVELGQHASQPFEAIPREDEDVDRGERAQALQKIAEGLRLIERLAARDRDTFR